MSMSLGRSVRVSGSDHKKKAPLLICGGGA